MGVTLELVTRDGCHLCDEMETLLRDRLPALDADFVAVDVDAAPDLRRRFGDTVPVLLRDGVPVAKVRLSALQLERIVRRRR